MTNASTSSAKKRQGKKATASAPGKSSARRRTTRKSKPSRKKTVRTKATRKPAAKKRATKKAARPAAGAAQKQSAKKTVKKAAATPQPATAAANRAVKPRKSTAKPPRPSPAPPELSAPAKVAPPPTAPKTRPRRIKVVRVESSKPKPVAAVYAPEDLELYRSRLEEKRTEILSLYSADVRHGQQSNEDGTEDLVDRANNAYSRELSFSISDSERALLMEIEGALERLQTGEFGICQHSRRPIPVERLRAVPWARYCIESQELFEKGLLD